MKNEIFTILAITVAIMMSVLMDLGKSNEHDKSYLNSIKRIHSSME